MEVKETNDKEVSAKLDRIIDRLTRRVLRCLHLSTWLKMQKALKPLGVKGKWTSYTRFVMDGGKTPPQEIQEITLAGKFITKYTNDGRFIAHRLYAKAEGKSPQEAMIKLRKKMELDQRGGSREKI